MASRLNIALKTAIWESGKKQKRIAKLARMEEPRLSRIVRGHDEPTPEEKARLAKHLHKAESELFPMETTA